MSSATYHNHTGVVELLQQHARMRARASASASVNV